MADDRALGVATGMATGWLVSLPVLGAGMACFWLQRDAQGALGAALGIGSIALLGVALLMPGFACALGNGRRSAGALLPAAGKSLLVALLSLAAASLLSMVKAFRPEEISFFAQAFASAQAMAATVPTVLAVGLTAFVAWTGGSPRRFVWIGAALAAGIAGVALWWWSAGVGYDAMRFSNADAILLVSQTVTLAALLVACVLDAVLCRP